MPPPPRPLSPSPTPFLSLQPWDRDPASPAGTTHYRTSPAFTFHAYSPPASPPAQEQDEMPSAIAPPALSTKRASRLSAPFPTFLYASEPPPVTARNKQRVRPSAAQLAELKTLYAETAHPTREEREILGGRIGMRYQSVTNWFQNQRSTAKKRGPAAAATTTEPGAAAASRGPASAATQRGLAAHTPLNRRTSMSRMTTPEPTIKPYPYEDDLDYVSGDDDVPDRHPASPPPAHHIVFDDEPALPPVRRQRTDPVRDIIIAQAAARRPAMSPLTSLPSVPQHHPQQQHLVPSQRPHQQHVSPSHLPLPLSGSAIMPSSFSAPNAGLMLTLPPAPRTTPSHPPSRGVSPPASHVSTFQVSRETSPALSVSTSLGAGRSAGGRGRGGDAAHRGKRSRPTPHQLAALRALHAVTASPSIEERTKVGKEIGMELGKVTNWFRNLRQTARKKERRAQEVGTDADAAAAASSQHDGGSHKRTRGDDASPRKRPRVLNSLTRAHLMEDDEDDGMSVSHRSTAFDTNSNAGSVDFDYEHERDMDVDGDHAHYGHREDVSVSFDRRMEHGYERRVEHEYDASERHHEHEHEHEPEARSELGTESDAAHEAVTPEPPSTHERALATTPCTSASASSRGSTSPARTHVKQASVDDAMLLLAFHGAQA